MEEDDEIVYIPFMGDDSFSNQTKPDQIADWVKPEDKVALICCLSLYSTPVEELEGFILVPNSYKVRVAAWFNNESGECIIGCRGTSPTSKFGGKDLKDDLVIAGFGSSYCDLSLVNEGQELYNQLKDQCTKVIFAGHSLGGTAAFCLCAKNGGTYSISYNGGAAPTNPVLSGPGPSRARFYHIVGDLISTHMSPEAAEVIRIKKPDSSFGTVWPHSSARVLKSDGAWSYSNADEEDALYYKWGTKYNFGWSIISPVAAVASFAGYLQKRKVARTSPIPGSQRFYDNQKFPIKEGMQLSAAV